jgi:predicted nuclease of predicted toxin-antitoxin system
VTVSFVTDEHVPSVFVTTLQSSGFDVTRATAVFGEGTVDRQLLEYCAEHDHILITNDKKDFTGALAEAIDHAGIVIFKQRGNPALSVR